MCNAADLILEDSSLSKWLCQHVSFFVSMKGLDNVQ